MEVKEEVRQEQMAQETTAQIASGTSIYWHGLDHANVFEKLKSDHSGLSPEEAQRRLERFGPNEISGEQRINKLALLWSQVKNPLVAVLAVAAAISLIAGKQVDAIVIGVVIIVNTLIGFLQEYRAEEALEKLKSQAAPEATVLRECEGYNGQASCMEIRIPATEVVPGDVIMIDAGDKVPADARVFEAINLEVDESMLTGESTSVRKITDAVANDRTVAERTNLIYGGTIVVEGRGKGVVIATGSATEMGKIATLIQETEKVTSPLQVQTADLGRKLALLAIVVAGITFLLGLIRGLALQDMFLFALASAVSSIPEGLPAVMTITLAVGVNRMARRNAIMRKLHAVDTLGAATVICTDKTGTLTTNQMTVQEIALASEHVHVTGVGFEPHGHFEVEGAEINPRHEELTLALRIGTLCNNARLLEHHHNGSTSWEVRGDPTEAAMVVAAAKAGLHKDGEQKKFVRVDEIPFSAKTKWMATFHVQPDAQASTPGKVWAFIKGAPEEVIAMCTTQLHAGNARPLDADLRERLEETNHAMAGRALRVLAVAYRLIDASEVESFKDVLQSGRPDLTLVGFEGMIDPPRPEVPAAVRRCRDAGIRVVMATGDHKLTGEAIAQEVGIAVAGDSALTGHEVEIMTDAELDAVVEGTSVFARVAPQHKHRIVESLRRHGNVVAMTGDGVNDAPALQAAEIGVAMGISGTDVTRETAEMVLADDNFASIVNAVEQGRVVFHNVRKVVKFLLATNIGEDLTLISALAFLPGVGLIITPVQILWVNLVTDGILDITLALEPQESDVMNEPPRKQTARIINAEILRNVVFVALFMAVGTLWMYLTSLAEGGAARAQTMAFTTLAMFQVFNALNCRSRDKSVLQLGLFTNRYLIGAIVVSILLQVASSQVPFMMAALGTVTLSITDWARIILVSSSVFIADEIRKFVQRRRAARI
jgi:P-type Ca2+ transporter type 2C